MPPRSDLSMQVTCTSPDSQGSHVSPPPPGSPSLSTSSESERGHPSLLCLSPQMSGKKSTRTTLLYPQEPSSLWPRTYTYLPGTSSPAPTPPHSRHSSPSLDLWVLFFGYSECLPAPGLVLSFQEPQCLHLGRGAWARMALVFCKVDPRGRAVVTHRAKERVPGLASRGPV